MTNVPPLHVLFEDNHLLAVCKPAGLPTMGVAAEQPSLLNVAKGYIKRKYNKPGNVYLGIVSRLDAPVTGVVLIARTSKAASRLSEQFRTRDVIKRYWALVERRPCPGSGTWTDWLRKDERHRKVLACLPHDPGAQEAALSYRTLPGGRSAVLTEIELITGRKHQIRVQCALHDCPILGDRKYGSTRPFELGIGLHARTLRFHHPISQLPIELLAPLPACWDRYVER